MERCLRRVILIDRLHQEQTFELGLLAVGLLRLGAVHRCSVFESGVLGRQGPPSCLTATVQRRLRAQEHGVVV